MTVPTSTILDVRLLARAKRRQARRKVRMNRRICAECREANPKPERTPSDYGLTATELLAHGHDLMDRHVWSPAEVRVTLANPFGVAA